MPEEQRLETRQGRHNVDWHARMTGRRSELMAQAASLRAHPELRDFNRFHIGQTWRALRLALWDEGQKRLVTFREARQIANG